MLPGGKAFLTTSTVLVDAVPSTVVTSWCTVAKDSKAHNSVTFTLPNSQERLRSLRRRSGGTRAFGARFHTARGRELIGGRARIIMASWPPRPEGPRLHAFVVASMDRKRSGDEHSTATSSSLIRHAAPDFDRKASYHVRGSPT